MKTKAFLFDLDGTLIDTMPAHFKTWQLVVKEMGSPLEGEALMNQLYGNGAELMHRIVPGRTFTEEEARAIVAAKEERYRALYGNEITVLEGAREFLELALQKNIPMGIGTASNQANIDFALDKLDLRRYLSAIVGADDVQLSKPHPETWLKLAAELNTPPEHCIVFEDAPKGVEAALAAGMKAVAITGHFSANDFGEYENILQIVPALNVLNIDELLYL
ncbi:HAD superfamily hydrolase (TIGR01509 family)/beta-phosphoglucomutase family hydrolase [Lacibacter cauensis]|uniref:HAD superfamily hydrolase (TIGR01509 family)/beta-phosphoglucomutase family hydrolase n=1 Tax=Lacibacter cauensis TaxID=510947 RepID=A0A562SPQ3_9BACT|nr:HAD family phosphatase [Lacibacter cauensis]TWI83133.1 HAD superfamily hydrolase (TIGR01509 family)/beta-phosphoglucomutase family hydrolase [Lacibacter cauensis]